MISGSGRSPGEGTGNPLQYPCLGNPVDRGAWWAAGYGAARVRHDLTTKPLIAFDLSGQSGGFKLPTCGTGNRKQHRFFFFFNTKHRKEGKSHLGQKGIERLDRNVL